MQRKNKQFLFLIDEEERAMIERIAKQCDRSMSWVLRKLVRKAHSTLYEVSTDGDALAEAGLR